MSQYQRRVLHTRDRHFFPWWLIAKEDGCVRLVKLQSRMAVPPIKNGLRVTVGVRLGFGLGPGLGPLAVHSLSGLRPTCVHLPDSFVKFTSTSLMLSSTFLISSFSSSISYGGAITSYYNQKWLALRRAGSTSGKNAGTRACLDVSNIHVTSRQSWHESSLFTCSVLRMRVA